MNQFDPNQYQQPAPPQRSRSGCQSCLFGCLVALGVSVVAAVALTLIGVFLIRQAFPTTESMGEAATCMIMRIAVNNAETAIEQSDASAAEKAELTRAFQELRTEFNNRCQPAR